MDNKIELKKSLSEKQAQLLTLCDDAKFGKKLIGDILSIKGMLSVEPTLAYVAASDVVWEIKNSAYTITQTKQAIVYKFNGFQCIITPGREIYNRFQQLIFLKNLSIFAGLDLSLYDTNEKVEVSDLSLGVKEMLQEVNKGIISKEELLQSFDEQLYKGLLEHCCLIPHGISLAFSSYPMMNKFYNFILDNINEMIEEASDSDNLSEDDPTALSDIKNDMDFVESLKQIVYEKLEW